MEMIVGSKFVSKISIQLEFFEFLKQVGSIFQSKITNVFKCIQWTQDWIIIKLLLNYWIIIIIIIIIIIVVIVIIMKVSVMEFTFCKNPCFQHILMNFRRMRLNYESYSLIGILF